MKYLTGKCVYEGVVIGKTYLDTNINLQNEKENISFEEIEKEKTRLEICIKKSILSLKNLKMDLSNKIDKQELEIIEAHLLLISDPIYISDIRKTIEQKQKKAEFAIKEVTEKFIRLFENINIPIYKQRGLDIKDVGNRLIETLNNGNENYKKYDEKILVTKEIYPTELLKIHKEGINLKGIIMEYGGETSHLAILAKALKIPTLMGVTNIFNYDWKEEIILDTTQENGLVIIAPNDSQIKEYSKKRENFLNILEQVRQSASSPCITKDGKNINLYLNLGTNEQKINSEIDRKLIAGVGLLRTELIYMNTTSFPSEEEQLKKYKQILNGFSKEQSIIIRTLDIGADKQLSYFKMKNETNPFLGLRGIRFSLRYPDIFETQLRAILRLSNEKNVKIMYPMITSINEIKKANIILEKVKENLKKEKIPFNEKIEVGIMVEVPSVILLAEEFAREVDFFSIGSNDLTQYILATDRLSETVGELYSSYNPAVLKAIYYIKEAADKYRKKVSVCGEMAGDLKAIIALLSLGIKDFSMVESSILAAKTLIRNLNYEDLGKIKESILNSKDEKEVKNILKKYINY
ncbi:Phosphoenolpyruvate-protein phosphotransferase [Fusobacterium necrogenes]|uniref:Phosphoenolpyruvate-protein phosphotransferase n=1 Tax=Fusobacterium necrogenes TaxID=858 RepID=A0A377GYG6_9FUSO|nr:phosphoenolpyruvate--protein phosphotransferase [Fusobacterium necrogenes]STO32008.1 Phosphoenolpyruvate-protein phosphotransferase [Fusobacterium necrogenes]